MDSVYVLHKPKVPVSMPIGARAPYRSGNGAMAEDRIIASGNVDIACVLSDLLASANESYHRSTTSRSTEIFYGYNNTLAIECCSKRITKTLQSIFSGHRHIHAALKKVHCEGRWMVQIHRCYHDKELIDEVCALVDTIPARQMAAEAIHRNGIVITPVYDGEQWRKYTLGNDTGAEDYPHTDDVRKPCSMMMNGNVLLYVEGPWFYLYEEIEKILGALENNHADNQCKLIAVDANEFSGDKQKVYRRLGEMMHRWKLPHLAGILCLYRNSWSTQGGEITTELLHNPFSKVKLPQNFIDILCRRHKMAS